MATVVRVWDDVPGPVRVLIGGRAFTLGRPAGDGPVPSPCDEHLVAGPEETSPAWLAAADVIVARAGEPARLLTAHPGCLVAVAVTEQGCLLAAGGVQARLDPVLGGTCTVDDAAAFASAVHAWLVTGGSPAALARLALVRENTVTVVRVRHRRTARPGVRRAAR
ncbi:hypothetical protein HUT06_33975 [Actinomadura sp. NAK00032]|uniref:hypothetical protein n=1 Tax=Actinomadura sp. NAK00032 TaxID=2742128 RepID=UPI0015917674|nr:hypothetical protein [Actinomadura sp. NAK00032]QKW38405.1 hypothetical protein HUT06_33975 [Actinomadura sp. NAK00032]